MTLALVALVFVVSLASLVKGADWLLLGAERIGRALGLSPFIIGVVLVGIGTSLPELISSVFALIAGEPSIVTANAIGSNIANILLVVGSAAVLARALTVTKSLIDLDLPLIAITTTLFVGVAYDGLITRAESGFLILAFIMYFAYTLKHQSDEETTGEGGGVLPRPHAVSIDAPPAEAAAPDTAPQSGARTDTAPESVRTSDLILLVVGVVALAGGAKYLIDSVIAAAELLLIAPSAVALFAVAVGTSLPELLVSAKAALSSKSEVALGNIFGSNVFNLLLVVGIPGLFVALPLDRETLTLALPVMVVATLLFVISGISRRIHIWEGSLYLVLYVFFIGRLFSLV